MKRIFFLNIFAAVAMTAMTVHAENMENVQEKAEFSNPIESVRQDAWYDYGTGDPYVMRYNGTYYLYMSTRDTERGIKCFSSRDLVSWNYEGLCAEEEVTKGAYAPEVIYYNGKFYMYSSPAGNGHYVFSSESPTGPFLKISDNLGFSIDGSVFIDHDGKWYFYHAGDHGITAHEMTAPDKINASDIQVNAYMDGWTEGPMVVWHDGKYYLTYTGNHVLSEGYRINYGSGDSPVKFTPGDNNPILLHTIEKPVGIGHSSTVKGPDLDSYYIVYHTLDGRAAGGMPRREMNIDRIVFQNGRMWVLGPTTSVQQAPDLPAVSAYFREEKELTDWKCENADVEGQGLSIENGYILSREPLGDQFTAEYNLYGTGTEGTFGGIFCCKDENNYGRFSLSVDQQIITIELMQEGEKSETEFALQGSFGENVDLSVMQSFQVEKLGEKFVLYFNDRLAGEFECKLSGGQVGYFAEGSAFFGFIGASNHSGGDSIRTYEKPLPGKVQGIHYESSADGVSCIEGEKNTGSVLLKAGDYAEYRIRVAESGKYNFSCRYAADQDVQYRILLDGHSVTEDRGELSSTGALTSYETGFLRDLTLKEGNGLLRIEIEKGEAAFSELSFSESVPVEDMKFTYDSDSDGSIYFDGRWAIKEGSLSMNAGPKSTGKRLYGDENWMDYAVEADFTFPGEKKDAGLMIRAVNPAQGGAGNDPDGGTYFFQGYYVGMQMDQLVLAKMNYNQEILKTVPMNFLKDQTYHLSVSVKGSIITVSLDGRVLFDYEDKDRPFLNGAAGVRCQASPIRIDNLTIIGKGEDQ